MAYDVAYADFLLVQNYDDINKGKTNPLAHRLIIYLDSVLSVTLNAGNAPESNSVKNITRINNFIKLCAFVKYYKNTDASNNIIKKNLQFLESYVNVALKNPKNVKAEQFNVSIELLLTLSDYSSEKINFLLKKISPFSESGTSNFDIIYPKGEKIQVDWQSYMSHNGGYQTLSYLYAAKGDYINLSRSLDSIITNNVDYKSQWNVGIYDIIYCLMKYQEFPSEKSEAFIKKYHDYSSLPLKKIYENITNQSINIKLNFYAVFGNINGFNGNGRFNYSLMKYFTPNEKVDKLWDYCLNQIKITQGDINDNNLNLAIYYKKR